jgi:hypothetical protein
MTNIIEIIIPTTGFVVLLGCIYFASNKSGPDDEKTNDPDKKPDHHEPARLNNDPFFQFFISLDPDNKKKTRRIAYNKQRPQWTIDLQTQFEQLLKTFKPKILITGTLGAGKSSLCRILLNRDVSVKIMLAEEGFGPTPENRMVSSIGEPFSVYQNNFAEFVDSNRESFLSDSGGFENKLNIFDYNLFHTIFVVLPYLRLLQFIDFDEFNKIPREKIVLIINQCDEDSKNETNFFKLNKNEKEIEPFKYFRDEGRLFFSCMQAFKDEEEEKEGNFSQRREKLLKWLKENQFFLKQNLLEF